MKSDGICWKILNYYEKVMFVKIFGILFERYILNVKTYIRLTFNIQTP